MNHAHREFAKHLFHGLKAVFKVFHICFFRLFYKRIDHIDLPALSHLAAQEVVKLRAFLIKDVLCLYGLAPGWQLVYHTHVQISVKSHGKGAGNRGGGHYKHMRRTYVLAPQPGSLRHAKAVLLVNYYNA